MDNNFQTSGKYKFGWPVFLRKKVCNIPKMDETSEIKNKNFGNIYIYINKKTKTK